MSRENHCFFCEKLLQKDDGNALWHEACAQAFFKDGNEPELDFSLKDFERKSRFLLKAGEALPGAQKKISLSLSKQGGGVHFVLFAVPSGYILKPQSPDFAHLPETEDFGMRFAELFGVRTCPHNLVRLKDGSLAYLTKRIDREAQGNTFSKIPMEDFAQLGGISPEDKYRGSYERAGKIIDRYSKYPLADKVELYLRILVSFLLGNSDLHYKNLSLLEQPSGGYLLARAYDMVPVDLYLQNGDELALSLNGKKQQLHRQDFLAFAHRLGLNPKTAEALLDRLLALQHLGFDAIQHSRLPKKDQLSFQALYLSRLQDLR